MVSRVILSESISICFPSWLFNLNPGWNAMSSFPINLFLVSIPVGSSNCQIFDDRNFVPSFKITPNPPSSTPEQQSLNSINNLPQQLNNLQLILFLPLSEHSHQDLNLIDSLEYHYWVRIRFGLQLNSHLGTHNCLAPVGSFLNTFNWIFILIFFSLAQTVSRCGLSQSNCLAPVGCCSKPSLIYQTVLPRWGQNSVLPQWGFFCCRLVPVGQKISSWVVCPSGTVIEEKMGNKISWKGVREKETPRSCPSHCRARPRPKIQNLRTAPVG